MGSGLSTPLWAYLPLLYTNLKQQAYLSNMYSLAAVHVQNNVSWGYAPFLKAFKSPTPVQNANYGTPFCRTMKETKQLYDPTTSALLSHLPRQNNCASVRELVASFDDQ